MTKVTIIGEAKPIEKKKPIEFVKCITTEGTYGVGMQPHTFDIIELISRKYCNKYDVMYARSQEERIGGVYYLGHFNDGIVEGGGNE